MQPTNATVGGCSLQNETEILQYVCAYLWANNSAFDLSAWKERSISAHGPNAFISADGKRSVL